MHDKLITDIESLRGLVGECLTETVVGFVAAQFLRWPEKDIGLSSPHRQLFYLLGLLLTTPEPSHPEEFDDARWEESKELLEQVFLSYALMYWPTTEEAGRLSQEWHATCEVAMPAFLHYFNSGLMASTEQVRDRIQRYVVHFDDEVRELLGISASDMLRVAESIGRKIQTNFDHVTELKNREEKERHTLLDKADKFGWNDEKMRVEATNSPYREAALAFFTALSGTFKIQRHYLERELDTKTVAAFWNIFTAERGSVTTLNYPTDPNPALELPLYLLGESEAIVPSVHSIYLAILDVVERALLHSDQRESFLRRRDEELEKEAARIFKDFCGDQATIVTSVYESENLQFEHDIVISWNRNVFIIEAKASPPREPLRDPTKAYVRIRDDFRSERGLQKAYEQAHRLEVAFNRGETLKLYNGKRELVLEISPSNADRIYCICVTRDNFGLLAADLSLLLDKDSASPFPWAVSVLDIETLFSVFSYFGWGIERFCEYLDGREKMHGRVTAGDELEFLGYLIEHGTFDYMFNQSFDRLSLNPSYTEMLNRIHVAQLGGEAVEYNPHPPVTTDLSAEVRKWAAESRRTDSPTKKNTGKQGRNEPCACGSGKKYKRCCDH